MLRNHVLLGLAWGIFCLLHSWLADAGVKHWLRQKLGSRFRHYRFFYTLFAFASLAGVIAFHVSIETVTVFSSTPATVVLGALVGLMGLAIMFVCIKKYFLSLSGLKSLYQEAPTADLMVTGIHRYVRHPLYTGTFLFIWGLWLILPSLALLVANIIITGYTLYALRLEEEKLVAEFGDQYREYQKNVPKLVPKF